MKLAIVDGHKKIGKEKELPVQFSEEYRPDLIKRALHALQSAGRQAYGAHPEAGMRSASSVSKRRRDYRGSYGFGISRVARKVLSRRGTRMNWQGAFTSQTVGGRRAHPPKSEKVLERKINVKENRKAIRSALAATVHKNLVEKRGHKLPAEYPFIVDSSFEQINKTSEIERALVTLGFADELARGAQKKVRAGLGKRRGRRYQRKKSVLFVVSGDCPLLKSARNLEGVEVVEVNALNVGLLAPGAMPGRVTLWSEKALDVMKEKQLYI